MKLINMLSSWVNLYKETFQSIKFSDYLKEFTKNYKSYFAETLVKLKNLGQTNFDLGIYHLNNSMYDDAILRFRLAKFFEPNNHESNYYLGRAYYGKYKLDKARRFLQEYINSPSDKFKAEADYTLKILFDKIENIKEIPESVIQLTFNQVLEYFRYHNLSLDSTDQQFFFEQLNLILAEQSKMLNNHVLELGTGFGVIGKLLKSNKIASVLVGMEISDKMANLCEELTKDGLKVYSKIFRSNAFKALLQEDPFNGAKFDVIVASDFISYNSNLTELFSKTHKHSKEGAILAISYKQAKGKSNLEFNTLVEQFYYSNQFVIDQAANNSWKLIKEVDIMFNNKELGKIIFFNKN